MGPLTSIGRKDPQPPEHEIARLAARQHGYVTYDQLAAAGLSRTQIDLRVRTAWLIRVHPKVYAVGHAPMYHLNRAAAAVLACGPGALLSHASAVALWGWRTDWPRTPEVTASRDRRPSGITVHRSTTIASKDRTRERGIPVTSPARTLLDMAPRLTEARLNRLYNDARLAHHVHNDELRELVGRVRNARLRRLITDENPTRSHLEDDFLALVKRYNLPRPHCNVVVAGFEVDFCYPEQR